MGKKPTVPPVRSRRSRVAPSERPLTHVDSRGRATMVDVSAKAATRRRAVAAATVRLDAAVRELLFAGGLPKGDALATARIAGIQAAKDTSRLIPLCHQVPLSSIGVEFAPAGADTIVITTEAITTANTGVEMEALVAASVAALTVYDMVKARCRDATIGNVQLIHKSGGKSGVWNRADGVGRDGAGGAA